MSALKSTPVQTTSTSSLPSWLTDLAKTTATSASETASKPYTSFDGNPYGGTSADSRSGFQMLRDWIGGGGGGSSDAIKSVMTAGPQKVATEGTFDGEGIDPYMNKYTDAAMTPALRKIQESADAARNRIKAGATAAGSFGDARHGVVDSNLDKGTSIAIGDTAGQMLNQAFGQAVASRQGDLSRRLQADTTSAGLAEQGLGRTLTGANALNNQGMDWIKSLLGIGQYQDAKGTAAGEFDYKQFQEGRDWDKNNTSWLMSLLQGTPSDRTSTQVQTGGPSPWMTLLGGLAQGAATGLASKV